MGCRLILLDKFRPPVLLLINQEGVKNDFSVFLEITRMKEALSSLPEARLLPGAMLPIRRRPRLKTAFADTSGTHPNPRYTAHQGLLQLLRPDSLMPSGKAFLIPPKM